MNAEPKELVYSFGNRRANSPSGSDAYENGIINETGYT